MRKKVLGNGALAIVAVLLFNACQGPAGPAGPAGSAGSTNVQTVLFTSLSSYQTVSSNTRTTVVFDNVVVDELSGYDETTGVYTVQEAGDYHVSFTVDWFSLFNDGDVIYYDIILDGVNQFVNADVTSGGGNEVYSLSTSIPNMTAGQTIEIEVWQNSGSDQSIFGSSLRPETHLAIDRLE